VIANLTRNWRLFVNASDNVVVQTNIGKEAIAYVDKYRSYWTQNGGVIVTAGQTLAQTLAGIDQNIQSLYILPDGQQGRGQVKYSFNLNTSYSFNAGILKGFLSAGR